LLQLLAASGAALVFEDRILIVGEVPGSQQIREIGAWLDAKPRAAVVSTISLGLDDPNFEPLIAVARGVLAAPVSSTAGEYLIWFRPERIRTVTWGGDPMKPVLIGEDPSDLSPRGGPTY
jgi:two-component system, chemotaxis family, sensor kinase Cph1